MTRQEVLRKYLVAMLCSEQIGQDAQCSLGPIWVGCDNEAIEVHDSATHQVDENTPPRLLPNGEIPASIVVNVPTAQFMLLPSKVHKVTLTPEVEITAHGPSGHVRTNVLDTITSRILYRMLNGPDYITDADDETVRYSNFMRWQRGNELRVSASDDTDFSGDYSTRSLTFTLETSSCITKGNCNDIELCFDFSKLTPLEKG